MFLNLRQSDVDTQRRGGRGWLHDADDDDDVGGDWYASIHGGV